MTGGFVFDVRSDGARRGTPASAKQTLRELARNPDVALVETDLRRQIALAPNDTR